MKLEELDILINRIILNANYDDEMFNRVALEVFQFQYENNVQYRQYCLKKEVDIRRLKHFSQIPCVTTDVFKDGTSWCSISSQSDGMNLVTSGTSTGRPGQIYRDAGFFVLREKAIRWLGQKMTFNQFQPNRVKIVFLDRPNRRNLPDFRIDWSLLWTIKLMFGTDDSIFLDNDIGGLKMLADIIREQQNCNQPVVIFGPSYRVSRFIADYGLLDISLPGGSMVMDSGGLKNKGGHNSMIEYQKDVLQIFNLNRQHYLNTYALSECGSQFPDDLLVSEGLISKVSLPWAKVSVVKSVDDNLIDCKVNEVGELIIYDLLNRGSVLAIATKDLALKTNNGFQIIGRR